MTPLEFHAFVALAYQTRLAQKKFNRTREDFHATKELERQLDEQIESFLKPRAAGLFDDEAWQEDAKELRW